MAAIDKTYIDNWKDYSEIKEWCDKQGKVTDDFGNTFKPINFLWEYEEKDFASGSEHPIWNTPLYFDIYLIRNCPLEIIQNNLKEQYGGGWSKLAFTEHNEDDMYEKIKNHTSPYDTYERNGTKGNLRFNIAWKYNNRFKDDRIWWWITVKEPSHMWYNEDEDMWYDDLECRPITSNVANCYGNISIRKLKRMLNKWNLPEGTVVNFSGMYKRYVQKEFNVTIKKKH